MPETIEPDQVNQNPLVKNTLTDGEYLETIKGLLNLMDLVTGDENNLIKAAISSPDKADKMFVPSLPGGWFYEHSLNEHINFYLHFAGLSEHFKELIDSGQFFESALQVKPVETPEWINEEGAEERMAVMLTALYTMQMSFKAIQITSWPISHFIAQGRKGDRSALKTAIRLDALAISSPTVAAEIMRSDMLDGGKFRNELKSALRYPRRVEKEKYGLLKFSMRLYPKTFALPTAISE